MVKTFEARRIVERLGKDKKLIADFLVKKLEYYESIESRDNLDEVRADIKGAREIVSYWENRNVVNRNLVKAGMQATELEDMLVESGLDCPPAKNTLAPVYIQHIQAAIEQKDDHVLREAYNILVATQNPDEVIVSTKEVIDAYFRKGQKESRAAEQALQQAALKKKQRKRGNRSRTPGSKTADGNGQYDAGQNESGKGYSGSKVPTPKPEPIGSAEAGQTDLEKALENVEPVAEVSLPASYDFAAGNNGTSKPEDDNGLTAPLRSRGFNPKKSKFQPEESPSYGFDDVIGLEELKEQIKVKMVYPYTMPERAAELGLKGGGGILLYGPPGTGKTSISRAVAGELGLPFFNITPDMIDERTADQTVKNINELFEVVRSYERSVIFMDEVNVLFPTSPKSGKELKIVTTFQTQLSGYESVGQDGEKESKLLMVGATNKPWSIYRPMLRFERFGEKIYVGFPDMEARGGLFKMKLEGRDLADDINYQTLAEWTVDANKGEVFSGADIAQICERAAEYSLRHTAKTGETMQIDMRLLRDIVDKITPTGLIPHAYDNRKMNEFRQEI